MIAGKEQQVRAPAFRALKPTRGSEETSASTATRILPPSNGLPSEARAARMFGEPSGPPDIGTRARMSVALQRSIGNARMGRMLTVPPAVTPTTRESKAAPVPRPAPVAVVPVPAVLPVTPRPLIPTTPLASTSAAPGTTYPSKPALPGKPPMAPGAVTLPSIITPFPAAESASARTAAAQSPESAAPETDKGVPPHVTKKVHAGARPGATASSEESTGSEEGAHKAAVLHKRPVAARTKEGSSGISGVGAPGEERAAGGASEGRTDIKLKMPEPPADVSPATKARIHRVQAAAGHAAAAHAVMPTAGASASKARAAVNEPPQETSAHAQEDLVTALGQRPAPSPEIEKLCADIYRIIREKRPPDEDSLVKADPAAMAKEAGGELNGTVQGDTQRVSGSYDQMQTNPQGTPQQVGTSFDAAPESADAGAINAAQATPDAVSDKNVSLDADAEASKKEVDQAGMNTDPAKLVQTGPIADARKAQGELDQTAKEDPAKVLAAQKDSLAKASADMQALQQSAVAVLAGARRTTVSGTFKQQHQMVGSEEQQRAAISAQAQTIFTDAQTKVNSLLQPLPQTAMKQWDTGVAVASEEFKQHLKKVEGWIADRHSGGWGAVVSLWDDVTGLPGWVTDEYDMAEKKFGDDVCNLVRKISTDVNGVVLACEAIIQDARRRIHDLFASLHGSLAVWAQAEEGKLGAQLDALHNKAVQTRDNFNKDLIGKASQSVQDVRQQIYALRQAAKGLIGKIKDAIESFIKDPVKFIIEGLLSLLGIPPAAFWAVVEKVKHVIKDIADDPLGFASNLLKAVGQGFSQFFDHILEHLFKGFIDWLTGGLASAGVQLPKDASLKSIITFILQLMGITWPRIRKLLAKHIGEENVALIEKVYSLVANLIAMGPEGVFEMIKEKLNPAEILKQIINAAVDYMMKAVVKAVAARIIMLFNPVGAILEALEAIYRVLKWIFTNAARIFHLVETIVNGVADIIAGKIGGMANAVESALAKLIPPVIDFLADYLGFGDLPDKVKDTIIGFQNWIEGLLDQAIGWLVEKGKALLKAIGLGGKDEDKDKEKAKDGQIGKKVSWTAAGESHSLWIVKQSGGVAVMMASETKPASEQIDQYEQMSESLEAEKKAKVAGLIGQARQLLSGLDQEAQGMAADIKNPDKKPEQTEAEESKVETEENELALILAQIREALGIADLPVAIGQQVIIKVAGDWTVASVDKIDVFKGTTMIWSKFVNGRMGYPSEEFAKSYKGEFTIAMPFDPVAKGNGPYKNLQDPLDVGPFKEFTAIQKAAIIKENRNRPENMGSLRSDLGGGELVLTTKRAKGVPVDPNEVNIDHIFPRSKGGWNSYANAQVLSFSENLKKLDTILV